MAEPLILKPPAAIQSVAFSPDGAFLAALVSDLPSSRNTVVAWDLAGDREIMRRDLGANARMLFVPATGRLAMAAGKEFVFWDLRASREVATRRAGEPQVLLVALPDGTLGGVAVDRPYYDDEDRPPEPDTIRITRLEMGEVFTEVTGRDEFQIAFAPGLNALTVLNFEHMDATTMGLWDLETQECVAGLDNTSADVSENAWFSADGMKAAWISGKRGMIRLFGIDPLEKSWKPTWEIPRPSAWAHSIDLGARGGAIAVWSSDVEEGTNKILATHVILIDAATGQERWRRKVDGKCYDVALAPDETTVAAVIGRVTDYHKDGADAYTLRVFDAKDGADFMIESAPARKGSLLVQHRGRINFSPDGKQIAVNHTTHAELWRVVRMPTLQERVDAVFKAMAGDEAGFKGAWHAAGLATNLVGAGGVAGAELIKLLAKPGTMQVLSEGEVILVSCDVTNRETNEVVKKGDVLLVKQAAGYVALGFGEKAEEVKALAERWMKKAPLEPPKPPPPPPQPKPAPLAAPVAATPAATTPAAPASSAGKPGWCANCSHQNSGPRTKCLYCGAAITPA